MIHGIAAIDNSTFFVRDAKFVLADLNTWGWVLLVVGIVQLAAAFGVWRQTEVGTVARHPDGVAQLHRRSSCSCPPQPVWTLMIFFVDIIVIFGLLHVRWPRPLLARRLTTRRHAAAGTVPLRGRSSS